MNFMMERIKQFFRKILLIHDSPSKIAGGAALGMFLGIMPGEGVLSAIILSSLFRLNRLAAVTAVLAFNMWTTLIILPLAAIIGSFIFKVSYQNLISEFSQVFDSNWKAFFTETLFLHVALPLIIGFLIVSVLISVFFYYLILFLLRKKKITLITQSGKIFDTKESLGKIKKMPKKIINFRAKNFMKSNKK